MKTSVTPEKHIKRAWHTLDAKGKPLGRLATQIATLLRGKGKVDFSYHNDGGDFVVVINAEEVILTGNKAQQKKYYRHSDYMGGLKVTDYETLQREHPERIIVAAVKGMLPVNRIQDKMLTRLKVVTGSEHAYSQAKAIPLS